MKRIDPRAWLVERGLKRQMSALMDNAVVFHFTRRGNSPKRGETPEKHASRVRPKLERALTKRSDHLSILTEIVVDSPEAKELPPIIFDAGRPLFLDTLQARRDFIRGVIDGGIGSFGVEVSKDGKPVKAGTFLDEVVARGVKHKLTLAHFLSDAGGEHNKWFCEQLPKAFMEYLAARQKSQQAPE